LNEQMNKNVRDDDWKIKKDEARKSNKYYNTFR